MGSQALQAIVDWGMGYLPFSQVLGNHFHRPLRVAVGTTNNRFREGDGDRRGRAVTFFDVSRINFLDLASRRAEGPSKFAALG